MKPTEQPTDQKQTIQPKKTTNQLTDMSVHKEVTLLMIKNGHSIIQLFTLSNSFDEANRMSHSFWKNGVHIG